MPRCRSTLRNTRCRLGAAGLLVTLLAACGGGGSSGGDGGSTNQTPSAAFSVSPSTGSAPLTVAFDAAGSSDPDGTIASYAWSFGDGGTASGATVSHVFDTAATFTVTLTVTDNRGATAQASQSVAVANNGVPTAALLRTPCSGNAPLTVFFDGTQSADAEGAITAYAWNFGDGTTATGANPTHVFNAPGVYDVRLEVTDAAGASATTRSTVIVSAPAPVPAVAVSGHARFERVPFSANASIGLDYNATTAQPLRQAIVELLAADGTTLATTRTDDGGAYALAAPQNVSARVRVRAQTVQCAPGWDIRVLNNTNANALYVMDSDAFNTGAGAAVVKDLVADSGWSGFGSASYSGPRVAAPFAIVDTLGAAARFVQDNGSADVHLPALEAFWSTRNVAADGDVADGDIVTTSYRSASPGDAASGIYVLGLENNDTDEFDAHILAHEFQHFLEDAISRTESTGGRHAAGERLDLRLAFSEGFANAYSGMVVGDPLYSDSLGPQQGQRFSFDLERNLNTPAGWFNEGSVQSVVWDLYDGAADGADAVNLGYLPLFEVLTGELRTGPALGSVFPFLAALKTRAGAPVGGITALGTAQSINGTDAWATGETNDGSVPQSLPVYTATTLNGAAQRVCGTTTAGSTNKIGNRLFLRFSLAGSQSVTIRARYTSSGSTAPFAPTADPDIVLYRNGFLDIVETTTADQETLSRTLSAGDYVIEVYEWSHVDPTYSAEQRRGNTCFDISVTG